MLKLTDCLKSWLVDNAGTPETASDEEFRKAAYAALAEGTLTDEKVAELCGDTEEEEAEEDVEKALAEIIGKAVEPLTNEVNELKAKLAEKKEASEENLADAIGKAVEQATKQMAETKQERKGPTPAELLSSGSRVRVKGAHEQYSTTKSALHYSEKHHHFPGQRAMYGDMPLDSPSQLDLAVCGSYFKLAVNAGKGAFTVPRQFRMTDHDKQLMDYAMRELPWTGIIGGDGEESTGAIKVDGRRMKEFEIKALLDDTTSGGLEAAPIVFDSAVITTPVLYGELFPLISVKPVGRGRRIEGVAIGNPTITSGTAEGTSISLFNTASLVSAFDTTIYNAVGAMEIGQDFQSDSPLAIGSIVTEAYGRKSMEWLDNQIANGDGTTEPQGVFNASGITDIGNPNGGANAAPQVVDYETLMFSLAKQYRTPADKNRCVFIANDTSYRRSRSISVSATDQRRVFGMETNTHADYAILGHGYKVQNDIANTVAGFFNLRYYRMYRRLGLNVRIETGGKELALKNLMLIVVRMRWGGKLELGGAGAYSDNWQT